MLIFSDIFNNDEFMSDTFPFTLEYDDCMMKVQSSMKAPEDVGNVDIGCGNAFGGGDEDTGAQGGAPTEKVVDIVYNANLQQFFMSKSEFMAYVKDYFGRIVKYLEENGKSERVPIFKKGATAFIKYIVPKFDEVEIYVGASKHEDDELSGGLAISLWEDDSASGPVFYFFKDALKEVKC